MWYSITISASWSWKVATTEAMCYSNDFQPGVLVPQGVPRQEPGGAWKDCGGPTANWKICAWYNIQIYYIVQYYIFIN